LTGAPGFHRSEGSRRAASRQPLYGLWPRASCRRSRSCSLEGWAKDPDRRWRDGPGARQQSDGLTRCRRVQRGRRLRLPLARSVADRRVDATWQRMPASRGRVRGPQLRCFTGGPPRGSARGDRCGAVALAAHLSSL